MERFTWRPRDKDGVLTAPVDIYLTDFEAVELRALAAQMRQLPPGEEQSRLLAEITLRLDIHAYFPDVRRVT